MRRNSARMDPEEYPGCYPRYYPEALETPSFVRGQCAVGWEPVRRAFEETFSPAFLERGAAVCVYHKGVKVVDLWGGERYLGISWEQDTITNCFSEGKGIAGLGIALLHSRGLLDYDHPVATYWPEFGCNGKEHVTVRQLLSHSVGVCVCEINLTQEIIADHAKLANALASTKIEWHHHEDKNGYMGLTIGWYDDILCRRIDPKRRSIVDFVKEEIAAKLECNDEVYCGLPPPDVLPRSRIASLNAFSQFDMVIRGKFPSEFINNFVFKPSSYAARTFKNPEFLGDTRAYGTEKVRALVVPAGNFVVSARAVASIYDAVLGAERPSNSNANNAAVGFTAATLTELTRPAVPKFDEVLRATTCFSLGFSRPNPDDFLFGSSDRAFGCPGTGGQFAFADPDADVAMAYVTNRLGLHLAVDPRELQVRHAVYEVLRTVADPKIREQKPDTHLTRLRAEGKTKETTCMDPCLRLGPGVLCLLFFLACAIIGVGLWLIVADSRGDLRR